jgi:hypothetical protein
MKAERFGRMLLAGGTPRSLAREPRRSRWSGYRAYYAMRNRCLNPNQARFKDYGARGIGICDRWLHGEGGKTGFACFLEDVGPKPSPAHSLERSDNDRGYDPDNAAWGTRTEQARNTRGNRIVDVWGERVPLIVAIEKVAVVSRNAVAMRLHRGWSIEAALLTPKGSSASSVEPRCWI